MFSGHCWRSENEVVSDLVLWEPKHCNRSVGGQARTFVDMLEADTGVPIDCLPAARDFCLLVVGWLLNVPATCECISGTDLHRQFYVLPH